MENRVLVLDKHRQPLMPCHPARARALLKAGKAAVFRRFPFTLILKERAGGATQHITAKADPGSKTTGLALVAAFRRGLTVIWAAELTHRGHAIHLSLEKRRKLRRSRRHRKTRYRAPRFAHRVRAKGCLPPSVEHRVDTTLTWMRRLLRWVPVTDVSMERVRFDMQALQNPEISGVEYQQGTLAGYEVKEYLLEKWRHRCAYCGAENVPFEIEHIHPRSRGGSNRASNLTLACRACNQRKGNLNISDFLSDKPENLRRILAQAKAPLKDAAAVNATRNILFERLLELGLPVETGTGGRTKFNRVQQGYPKVHWIDAACVGESGAEVRLNPALRPLQITATGYGRRQMQNMTENGFPRGKAKSRQKVYFGFQTGDMVRAIVTEGQKVGVYQGRVACRKTGSFKMVTATGKVDGIHHRFCKPIHRQDGYSYAA